MMNARLTIKMFVLNGISLLLFSGCGLITPEDRSTTPTTTGDSIQGEAKLPPVNYFTKPRPSIICGEAGYAFLAEQYFQPRCGGSCHSQGGTIPGALPYFGDSNSSFAYQQMQYLSKERITHTVTKNSFCGDSDPDLDCNLKMTGEVYVGIIEWINNRNACP